MKVMNSDMCMAEKTDTLRTSTLETSQLRVNTQELRTVCLPGTPGYGEAISEPPLGADTASELQNRDKEFLIRLTEYFKYLYEEENKRRDILNDTTKIYLAAFGFVVGVGLLKVETIEKLASILKSLSINMPGGNYIVIFGTILFFITAILFLISFTLTILVVKMWKRERLCNPQEFLFRAMTMSDENRLLSAIVADYVVTANRNHDINERKALLLSKALLLFILAIMVFTVTWILLQVLDILWRNL